LSSTPSAMAGAAIRSMEKSSAGILRMGDFQC
jgi:hypothetical protein